MRLLTHNSLRCARKDVTTGFPLQINPENVEVRPTPCNRQFIAELAPNLHWPALRSAAAAIGVDTLPESLEPALLDDVSFLDALHHVLMDVHVTEGRLQCPESGQIFPIHNGIPDMMLPEDLVP